MQKYLKKCVSVIVLLCAFFVDDPAHFFTVSYSVQLGPARSRFPDLIQTLMSS